LAKDCLVPCSSWQLAYVCQFKEIEVISGLTELDIRMLLANTIVAILVLEDSQRGIHPTCVFWERGIIAKYEVKAAGEL
jgi:hypothetical protein